MAASLRGWLRDPWVGFVMVGLAANVAFYALPDWQDGLYLLIGGGSAAAILVGQRIHRPARRGWVTVAAGIGLYSIGDLIYTVIANSTGTEPFPSPADASYLAGQLLVVVGVGLLAVPLGRGLYRPALIDAAMVATAGAFIAWPILLDPLVTSQVDSISGSVALSYPLIDLVVVGVLARHLLQPGRKSASVLLLIGGVGIWLVADLGYAGMSMSGEYVSGMWLDSGWLMAYVLVGASALHPSMAQVVPFEESHEATISNRRLGLIGLVVVVPIVAFVAHGPLIHPGDFPAFAIGSIAVGVLGSARLLGALHASRVLLADQRALEWELARRARTDRLTGLDNREALRDRLTDLLGAGEGVGLVFLDLDDFKRINDAFGHPTGQQVLREVARRLLPLGAEDGTVARLGGDEFAIVVRACADEAEAVAVALRVTEALEPEVNLSGRRFRISASIGIVWSIGGDLTADEILSRADIAMYQAKAVGGACYAMFEPEMHDRALARTQLQSDLDGAVARGEIQPWFQPIFDVMTQDLVGFEALARWRHPERGLVAPDEFIPIAELSGAITEIDRHIGHVAAEQVAVWTELLQRPLQLHVNITPREAADPATVASVASALAESGLHAGSLVVEVTETALIDETAVAPVLVQLKALGCRLSIDDFGSRYAVLTQLGRLPIDIVKLDRSVVAGIGTMDGSRLFEGIIRLAQSLHLETVAEGVESLDVMPTLRRLGCDRVQGFAFGRPMPASEASALVLSFVDESAIA